MKRFHSLRSEFHSILTLVEWKSITQRVKSRPVHSIFTPKEVITDVTTPQGVKIKWTEWFLFFYIFFFIESTIFSSYPVFSSLALPSLCYKMPLLELFFFFNHIVHFSPQACLTSLKTITIDSKWMMCIHRRVCFHTYIFIVAINYNSENSKIRVTCTRILTQLLWNGVYHHELSIVKPGFTVHHTFYCLKIS